MNDDTLQYTIALTLIKGVGNNIAKTLIAYLGSAEAVFRENQSALAKIPGIGTYVTTGIVNQHAVLAKAANEIDFIRKNNITALSFIDKKYPYRLKECPDAPVVIFTKGNCDFNAGKFIGIVGTRNATEYGKENCRELIKGLAEAVPDAVIVSGLAYGVDICAHKAALDNGLTTIGVVGHGLDRLYPSAHHSTAKKMQQNGAIFTEYISGTNPDRQNFVQRNRIIAGLCDVLVIVESAAKGGALITAELANDYNRDVFAFPGRVKDEWSEGCNALIKNNKAALLTKTEDLLKAMNWNPIDRKSAQVIQPVLFPDLSEEEQSVVTLLRQHPDGVQVNSIAIDLARPFSKVSSMLLEMEFKGVIKCLPGGIYRVVK